MAWRGTFFTILFLQLQSLGAAMLNVNILRNQCLWSFPPGTTYTGRNNIDPDIMLEPGFPPAKPSLGNLYAVCLNGNGRPRYPASCFPPSSHAYARRAGNVVNRVESWFSQCCYGGVAKGHRQILCCAKKAWETALTQFCVEEYSTMTLVHDCCGKRGEDRFNCFERQAPNPSYQVLSGYTAPRIPPDMTFTWNPNTC